MVTISSGSWLTCTAGAGAVQIGFLPSTTWRSWLRFDRDSPHSIGFSGGQLSAYVEGSSALDFPWIHDARPQDQSQNKTNNIKRL